MSSRNTRTGHGEHRRGLLSWKGRHLLLPSRACGHTPPPPTLKKLMHVDPHATFTEAHTERYTTAYVEPPPLHPHH